MREEILNNKYRKINPYKLKRLPIIIRSNTIKSLDNLITYTKLKSRHSIENECDICIYLDRSSNHLSDKSRPGRGRRRSRVCLSIDENNLRCSVRTRRCPRRYDYRQLIGIREYPRNCICIHLQDCDKCLGRARARCSAGIH